MPRIEITEAEIFDELNEAMGDIETGDGHTSPELRAITGWGNDKIRAALRALILAGTWEAVHVRRESPLRPGVVMPVCGYRPVQSD